MPQHERKIVQLMPYFKKQEHHSEPISKEPSMTVPDETISIREIVERFIRTGRTDERLERQEGGYVDEPDFDSPDLEKLRDSDLFEKEEYKTDLAIKNLEETEKHKQAFLNKQKKQVSDRLRADEVPGQGTEGSKKNPATNKDRAKNEDRSEGEAKRKPDLRDEE